MRGCTPSWRPAVFVPWERLREIADHVDLFYYDLKGIVATSHKNNTGVDNGLILDNARQLSEIGKPIVFRLVMVPGHNVDSEHLTGLDRFLTEVSANEVHVLPYHNNGEAKLDTISSRLQPLRIGSMSAEEAESIAQKLKTNTRQVIVGGG